VWLTNLQDDFVMFQPRHLMAIVCFCAMLGAITPSAAAEQSSVSQATSAVIGRWSPLIKEASRRFGIAEDWIKAVMRMESGGHTSAAGGHPITSPTGAMGLMQLMPETWRDMQRAYGLGNDPYDPHDNVMAGAAYLRWLYGKFGFPKMFAAYNAGPGTVGSQTAGTRELPQETRNYVRGIATILGAQTGHAPKSRAESRQTPPTQVTEAESSDGMVVFTRPDGSQVSIDPTSVTSVRAAMPDEFAPGVQTVVSVGEYLQQGVLESLDMVEGLLRRRGANV
jgi:Transglycosylase SLT domain